MATIIFRLSTKVDKTTQKHGILVRFYHGKKDLYAKTGLFASSDLTWDEKTQVFTTPRFRTMTPEAKRILSETADLNAKLAEMKNTISEAFYKEGVNNDIDSAWLASVISDEKYKSYTMLEAFDKLIERDKLSVSRKRHFMVLLRTLKRFMLYQGINLDIMTDEFKGETLADFESFMRKEHTLLSVSTDNKGEKVLSFNDTKYKYAFNAVPESRIPEARGRNTIHHNMSMLRAFFKWAIKNQYATGTPFATYKIEQSKYGTPYYITIEERNELYHHDFSKRPQLGIQRDIFVFQCVIGCRVSDLKNLTKDCVIDGAIEYVPRKTITENLDKVRVPLNAIAREILAKYADTPGNKLLPFISDTKYNDAIKEMFTESGLTRLVTIINPTTGIEEKRPLNEIASSHLARRTFIGNLYKQVKDPNLIGKLSGHAEGSRAFARYRDIDEEMRKELVTMLE